MRGGGLRAAPLPSRGIRRSRWARNGRALTVPTEPSRWRTHGCVRNVPMLASRARPDPGATVEPDVMGAGVAQIATVVCRVDASAVAVQHPHARGVCLRAARPARCRPVLLRTDCLRLSAHRQHAGLRVRRHAAADAAVEGLPTSATSSTSPTSATSPPTPTRATTSSRLAARREQPHDLGDRRALHRGVQGRPRPARGSCEPDAVVQGDRPHPADGRLRRGARRDGLRATRCRAASTSTRRSDDDYGKLARLDLEGQREGARVEAVEGKRNPSDFAVWRTSRARARAARWSGTRRGAGARRAGTSSAR